MLFEIDPANIALLDNNQTFTGTKTYSSGSLKAPDVTSTDDFIVNVAADKQIVLAKSGGGYDWMHIPILLGARSGVSAPDDIALTGNTTLYGYAFNGASSTVEELHTLNSFGMPHNYVEGEDIKLYIVSCGINSNAGNIKWNIDWSYANLPAGEMSATTTQSVVLANPGLGANGRLKFTDAVITLTGASFTIGTNINLRIYRNPDDADDTYGSDAILQGCNFHIPVNSLGSRQELVR